MSWSGKNIESDDTLYFQEIATGKEVGVQVVRYEEKENGRVFYSEETYTCADLEMDWNSETEMVEWFESNGYTSDY